MTHKVTKPIALDESFRTTGLNPQNIADVLANKLDAIKSAIENGGIGEMEAAFECHYNVTSATDIYNAMQDKKVPFFYQNGVVAQLWKVETNKYTFRTTTTSQVEGENLLTIVDYIVNGAYWETHTKQISGGSSSQQAYLAKVESSVNFDTTGLSGMQSIISVNDVPADGVYQLSIFMCITPKTASSTKSDLVFQFTGTSGTGMPNTTFHAVVDDSQTFGQQLSFSTTLNLKAGTNTLKMACGGLNTEYLVFVDDLTVAQLVNGVYHNGDDFADVHTLTEAADFNNDDGVLVDGATGGPRFMLWQTLANKVLGFIKSLSTTITAFRSGDVIPVDGPSGTAKMSKDDLLRVTAENALGSIHSLSDAATEADLVAGNYLVLDGSTGTNKLPANIVPACKIVDRGSATIATINALAFKQDGWKFVVSDSGTLSAGSLDVTAGDSVVWNATANAWFLLFQYAREQVELLFDRSVKFSTGVTINKDVYYLQSIDGKYGNNSGGLSDNHEYISYIYDVIADTDIYCSTSNVVYLSLSITNKEMTSGVRYRRYDDDSEDTLPTENSPASVKAGQRIIVSVKKNRNFNWAFTMPDEIFVSSLNDELKRNVNEEVVDYVKGLALDENCRFLTFVDKHYGDNNGRLVAGNGYKSWIYDVPATTELYVTDSTPDYLSISVTNTEMTSGVRYRKYVDVGEDNLPTSGSPIIVDGGKRLIITVVRSDTSSWEFELPDVIYQNHFQPIPLDASQVQQVIDASKYKIKVKYNNSASFQSTESVDVYVPQKVGFCHYSFGHCVDVGKNCDCWRVVIAYAVDEHLVNRYDLTHQGEWECALKLQGRPDFAGGYTHGDEVIVGSPSFFIDGKQVSLSDISSITECEEFRVVTKTSMYDPNDGTTLIAYHGCEHLFSKNGLRLRQDILWQGNFSLRECYLAMNLVKKSVSTTYYTDADFDVNTIPDPLNITIEKARFVAMIDESNGVFNEFSIGKNYPEIDSDSGKLLLTDNGGDNYNKGYYIVCKNATSTSGELWKSESFVDFKIGK